VQLPSVYIPVDRRRAIAAAQRLPDRATGAVLFADISGFTPLTAALLEELGLKRGPEELTRQLNLVYDALINQVHGYGGSVLGFAGDAITCWFEGDDGRRATACGLALQEEMRQFASILTPNGTQIALGVKAAIAAGPVRRFLVGDPAIQYIDALAGATLDRMATAEHLAEPGDVVVAPEVAADLGDLLSITGFRTDPKRGLQFAVVTRLTSPVAEARWPAIPSEQRLSDEQARPWLLRPVFDRLKSGQGQYLAEIRPAVALFLRFGGIEFDADDLAGDRLDGYIRWVQGVLARYEGNLVQLTIGDKGCYLYAAFGAPITHGDDPARATAAALELQSPPPRLAFVGPVQVGISQGRMRTGAYGGKARSTYGVLGDEVNMAARLMQLAPPGQIMVSQSIAAAVRDAYRLVTIGPTRVKGKAEPIPVYRVEGRHKQVARKPVSLYAHPLLGREAELAQLAQALETTLTGEGQILRVQGVAGIGKSHLIAEFGLRALRQGWRVVAGGCQSTGTDISYLPWRQIFRDLLLNDAPADDGSQIEQLSQTVTEMNPAWQVRLPLLGDLLNLPIPDNPTTAAFEQQLRQEALFTFAVDLIHAWAQLQPLLIIVEDVHWLDEASRGLALALARVAGQMPLALTVVHRPPLDKNRPILPALDNLPGYNFLDLAELPPEGVAGLVTFKLQGQPSPLLLEVVQTQAFGNPFFVEELVNTLRTLGNLQRQSDDEWDLSPSIVDALRRTNCLTTDAQGRSVLNPDMPLSTADLGLPDSIQGLVLARLDRLLEDHKLTVKVASVIGREFQFKLLARAHPVQPGDEALLAQVRRDRSARLHPAGDSAAAACLYFQAQHNPRCGLRNAAGQPAARAASRRGPGH
jgi:class 3 adenylate cyclase